MKGSIKTISTGEDLANAIALLQSAPADEQPGLRAELSAHVKAIEERGFISVPIISRAVNGKSIVIRYCGEIRAGNAVKGVNGGVVTAVEEVAPTAGSETADGMEDEKFLTVKLSKALPDGAPMFGFTSPVNPLEELGITPEGFEAVKEVLKS
jgi:hypothetical protein